MNDLERSISRRDLLRGAGTAMALSFLHQPLVGSSGRARPRSPLMNRRAARRSPAASGTIRSAISAFTTISTWSRATGTSARTALRRTRPPAPPYARRFRPDRQQGSYRLDE